MLPDAHPNPTGPTARGPSASIRHPLAGRRPIVPIGRRDRPSGPDPGEDRTPPPVPGCAPTAARHPLPLSATALSLTHNVRWRRASPPMPGRPVAAAVGLRPPAGRQVRTRSLRMAYSGPVPTCMTRSYTMTIQSGQDPFLAYDLFRTRSRLYDPFIYNDNTIRSGPVPCI